MNFIQYITKKSIILEHKKSCYVFRFRVFFSFSVSKWETGDIHTVVDGSGTSFRLMWLD